MNAESLLTFRLFLAIDWSSLNEANELALESIQNATDLDLNVTGLFMDGHLPIGKTQKALAHLRLLFDKIQEMGHQELETIHLGALEPKPDEVRNQCPMFYDLPHSIWTVFLFINIFRT